MKTKILSFLLIVALSATTCMIPQKSEAQVSVSFQVFYDDLSPYGNWVDYPEYGYVWVPDVDAGFSPYSTHGYWVYTYYGWTWVSTYSWGWAPFHYGRWFYESYYGWMWVPDNEWGPGWVTWRRSNDYYGWAPIRPGISIEIAYSNQYDLPYDRWTFVRNRDFGRTNINNYYINRSTNVTIINNTTIINNIQVDRTRNVRYNAGPDRNEAERVAGRKFNPVAVRENTKPVQRLRNNELEIYRPRVDKNYSADRKPAPSRVVDLKAVKTPAQRINENRQQQEQKNDQLDRQKQQQQQRNDQLDKQKQQQEQKNNQLEKQKQDQQQRNNQLEKQKQDQQQRNNQLEKQKQDQQQRNVQLEKQKQDQQQRNVQLNKQKEQQQQKNVQLEKQKQEQQQRNVQLERQKEQQQQKNIQLEKQKQEQQQRNTRIEKQKEQQQKEPGVKPAKQPPTEQQKNEPGKKKEKGDNLYMLLILPFIFGKKSNSDKFFTEALRNENKGDFEAAVIAYENALNEEKKTRFSSNRLKNLIIDKLKVLHTMIEYKNNLAITRDQSYA